MNRRVNRFVTVSACLASFAALSACAAVGIVVDEITKPVNGSPSAPPTPAPPIVAEPPKVEPPVIVEPAPTRVLVNLNIVVHDATGAGINGAACIVRELGPHGSIISIDERIADGSGFLNFPVGGTVEAQCRKLGFVSRAAVLPPGDHRFPLERVAAPTPAPPLTPAGVFPQCGAGENTGRISDACLSAVASVSMFYPECHRTGNDHACHYYTREVARALNAAQQTERYGLIKKTKGGDNVEGYGEDVVAFLPLEFALDAATNQWRGADIVGGTGAPNARYVAGAYHPAIECDTPEADAEHWCNRPGDLWAPVPKAKQ